MDPEPERTARLSVVIPTLNEAGTIEACIASLGSLASENHRCRWRVGGCHRFDSPFAWGPRSCMRRPGADASSPPEHTPPRARGFSSCMLTPGSAHRPAQLFPMLSDHRSLPSAHSVSASIARIRSIASIAWLTRFDSIWTSFGDQGILIRRDLYTRIGGFDRWPLLEMSRCFAGLGATLLCGRSPAS